MFEVKNLSREEIVAKVEAHCALGVKNGRSPDFPRVGCGNKELVTQIVLNAINWMDTPEKIATRKCFSHQTLAWVVATQTCTFTQDSFSWAATCKVIENAGEAKIHKNIIDVLATHHPYAARALMYTSELRAANVKSSMRRLAAAILWMEAYTFLVEEGYDYNEDRF